MISLNRPDKANAQTMDLLDDLNAVPVQDQVYRDGLDAHQRKR